MFTQRGSSFIIPLLALWGLSGLISVAWAHPDFRAPLSAVLESPAGELIFAEILEGSVAAKTILGTQISNPTRKLKRLSIALQDAQMKEVADELGLRVERIYQEFRDILPERANALFLEVGGRDQIQALEGRILRNLTRNELDTQFLQKLKYTKSYREVKQAFVERSTPQKASILSPEEHALVFWETQKNAVASRSAERVAIEHYEVPLSLILRDVSLRMPKSINQSLIFQKDGKPYFRWVINPEDTRYFQDVEKLLKRLGISTQRHRYFHGYKTASRSYIIKDPLADEYFAFSLKGSTNSTGGNWVDKKQPVDDALQARQAADYVDTLARKEKFKNIVTLDEPALFALKEIDQAILIRTLGDLPSGDVTYLPGFSALHTELGTKIALANGSKDPAQFWNEHYNKPLARALAEFAARTGLTYDSPHSQNFLIEMVGVNPTGRIVLRDFGDTYASADFFKARNRDDFLKSWDRKNISNGNMVVTIGVLHGNEMPLFMNDSLYEKWGRDFYEVFEDEFSAVTGIARADLVTQMTQNKRYFTKTYNTRRWKEFFDKMRSRFYF